MGKHRPGEGMTPVTDLIGSVEPPVWPGADEGYGDDLRDMQMSEEEKRDLAREVFQERTADADTWYQDTEVDA